MVSRSTRTIINSLSHSAGGPAKRPVAEVLVLLLFAAGIPSQSFGAEVRLGRFGPSLVVSGSSEMDDTSARLVRLADIALAVAGMEAADFSLSCHGSRHVTIIFDSPILSEVAVAAAIIDENTPDDVTVELTKVSEKLVLSVIASEASELPAGFFRGFQFVLPESPSSVVLQKWLDETEVAAHHMLLRYSLPCVADSLLGCSTQVAAKLLERQAAEIWRESLDFAPRDLSNPFAASAGPSGAYLGAFQYSGKFELFDSLTWVTDRGIQGDRFTFGFRGSQMDVLPPSELDGKERIEAGGIPCGLETIRGSYTNRYDDPHFGRFEVPGALLVEFPFRTGGDSIGYWPYVGYWVTLDDILNSIGEGLSRKLKESAPGLNHGFSDKASTWVGPADDPYGVLEATGVYIMSKSVRVSWSGRKLLGWQIIPGFDYFNEFEIYRSKYVIRFDFRQKNGLPTYLRSLPGLLLAHERREGKSIKIAVEIGELKRTFKVELRDILFPGDIGFVETDGNLYLYEGKLGLMYAGRLDCDIRFGVEPECSIGRAPVNSDGVVTTTKARALGRGGACQLHAFIKSKIGE
jgi:hypothetical protein